MANQIDLPTANKKYSQGLCFIGKVRLPEFLQQQLEVKPGEIIEIPADNEKCRDKNEYSGSPSASPLKWNKEDGEVVGQHQGAHFFTVGQRRGLNVGGKAEPLFVLSKDVIDNVLYVGQGEDHPGLLRRSLRIHMDELHWIREDLILEEGALSEDFEFRFRYRQPLQKGTLRIEGNHAIILFQEPQSCIAAGQFAAWYQNDECIGSVVISD